MDMEISGAGWIILGLLGYIALTAYMAFNYVEHMKRHPFIGLLLFVLALVLGPISLIAFFGYAVLVGTFSTPPLRQYPAQLVRTREPQD